MTPEKLISRHPLDNGLTLEFWDLSRPMAGDRWQVALEARIPIPVNAATLPPELLEGEAEVERALGTSIIFAQRDVRTFVDAKDLDATLKEMETRLLSLAPAYFGHPEFAGRLIRKRFAQYQDDQRWHRQQTQ
jgi:hypothetical protein